MTYSLQADYFDGIDLQVKFKGETYCVSLFVDTRRANAFKEKKYHRHDYSNRKEITLEIDLKKSPNQVSNFSLYPESVLLDLISKMEHNE